ASRSHRELHSLPTRRSSDLQVSCSYREQSKDRRVRWQVDEGATEQFGRGVEIINDVACHHIDVAQRPLERAARHMRARSGPFDQDRKSTRLNSSHVKISYAV